MTTPTYRDLLEQLQKLTPEQLIMTPTVYVADMEEYYPIRALGITKTDNDVLDENHPYLYV